MRVAFISDVHANYEALAAVIKDIEKQKIEKVFFLGDAVGYGVDPDKCTKIIDSLCEIKLLGNHDFVVMGLESASGFNGLAKESIAWTRARIKQKTIELLSDFEMDAVFLDYYMVHSSPEDPGDWNYIIDIKEASRAFEKFSQNFCFIGHSHLPSVFCLHSDGEVTKPEEDKFTADVNCRYIINVGSVGQPRDGCSDPCYLIAETEGNLFEFRRVSYDLKTAQKKMKKARLPEYLITRLENGK